MCHTIKTTSLGQIKSAFGQVFMKREASPVITLLQECQPSIIGVSHVVPAATQRVPTTARHMPEAERQSARPRGE